MKISNIQRVWILGTVRRIAVFFETSQSMVKTSLFYELHIQRIFIVFGPIIVFFGHSLCLKSAVVSAEKII